MISGANGRWILFGLVMMSVGVVALIGIVTMELWRDRKNRAGRALH